MKIERLRIDAFGQFHSFERELGAGLNVFHGPNEAGKSTLLAFIRAVLFGFSKRGEPARYEPDRGTIGGELLVKTAAGAFWVRRSGSRRSEGELLLRSQEGERLPPSRLNEALCAISRELFCQVFAFGLHELSSFEELASEGTVSQALFAAGMLGARRLPFALASLEKTSKALFASRGSKAQLNSLLAELWEVLQRIAAIGDRPRQYFEQRAELDALDEQLRIQSAARRAVERERDVLRELQALLCQSAELRVEQNALQGKSQELEFERKSLQRLCIAEQDAARWRSSLASFEARVEQWRTLEGRRQSLEDKERTLQAQLASLALPIASTDLIQREPESAKRALELLGAELVNAMQPVARAREQCRSASDAREASSQQLERIRSEIVGLPDLPASELRRAQTALSRLPGLRAQGAALDTVRQDRHDALATLEIEPPLPKELFPFAWALITSGAFLGLGGIAAHLSGPSLGTVALAGSLCFTALVLFIQRRARRAFEAATSDAATRRFAQAERRSKLLAELRDLDHQGADLQQRVLATAKEAGIPADADHRALQERADALLSMLNGIDARERLCRELEKQQSMHEQRLQEERSRIAELELAEQHMSQLRASLKSMLQAQGLPAELSADAALRLWAELSGIRQAFLDLRGHRLALVTEEQACGTAANSVLEASAGAGLTAQEPLGAATELRALLDRADQAAADLRRANHLLAQNEERASRLTRTAGQFEQRIIKLRRQTELDSDANAEEQLLAACGQRLRTLEPQLSELENRQRALAERKGGIAKDLEAWEKDSELAQLRSQEEFLRGRIVDLSQEYVVQRLAAGLLKQARWRHEREQQPKVIRIASQLFAELTAGRYACVYTQADAPETLFVADAQGREWRAEQLSRGTREQLYLAFRLAVIQDFGETRQALPVILDDILVNFDPERAQHAVKTLARISKVHQVVAFTCHPQLRDIFQKQGAQLLSLSQKPVPLLESA